MTRRDAKRRSGCIQERGGVLSCHVDGVYSVCWEECPPLSLLHNCSGSFARMTSHCVVKRWICVRSHSQERREKHYSVLCEGCVTFSGGGKSTSACEEWMEPSLWITLCVSSHTGFTQWVRKHRQRWTVVFLRGFCTIQVSRRTVDRALNIFMCLVWKCTTRCLA